MSRHREREREKWWKLFSLSDKNSWRAIELSFSFFLFGSYMSDKWTDAPIRI